MVRPRVFMDVTVGSEPLGRIIFELYNDIVPKTCENFRALCTGEKGRTLSDSHPLYYKNAIIHRSIKDFMIQGGDFTKRNGTGGESIYGGMFEDEDLSTPLDSKGLLCMANRGPNTNGSQFFITLRECPHLNGKHVVFGKVLRGYDEVVQKIVEVPVDAKDRPTVPVIISNCGELELRKKAPAPPPEPEKRSASVSDSEDEAKDKHRSSKRRSRRSRSRSPSDSDDSTRRRHKKSKRKHKSRKHKSDGDEVKKEDRQPQKETEEEYDARLEREEQERFEAARKRELERAKARYEEDAQTTNGVRYKGRGRMKYVDPDVSR
ncbi:hypothetical protein PM082_016175 [Marasmius tenuissimus]|nr:hypothetical protein PM082_016175 [Marasmius tenuissimus]